ncbi:MAG: hypothetical protein RIC87_08645 [Kiloniellales bacterium]
MRTLLFGGIFVATMGIGTAWADCSYGGYYYSVGSTVCFDGWLQECTVAGYWKAIGMCKAPTAAPVEQSVDAMNRLLALAESLPSAGQLHPEATR